MEWGLEIQKTRVARRTGFANTENRHWTWNRVSKKLKTRVGHGTGVENTENKSWSWNRS